MKKNMYYINKWNYMYKMYVIIRFLLQLLLWNVIDQSICKGLVTWDILGFFSPFFIFFSFLFYQTQNASNKRRIMPGKRDYIGRFQLPLESIGYCIPSIFSTLYETRRIHLVVHKSVTRVLRANTMKYSIRMYARHSPVFSCA